MIIDAKEIPDTFEFRYDVCIVGAGAAGITVANELAPSGHRICVVESGHRETSSFADKLKSIEHSGIPIKAESRERILGGTTTTWTGLSAPLDPIDFEERSYLSESGWPISLEDLKPHYIAASERYDFPPFDAFAEGATDSFLNTNDAFDAAPLEKKPFLARSNPQDFGKEFASAFESKSVDLFLGLSAYRIRCPSDSNQVAAIACKTKGGRSHEITAKAFVIASNAIESIRLLLNSKTRNEAGLGNEHGILGRYFMNHPKFYAGLVHLKKPLSEGANYLNQKAGSFEGYQGLRLNESQQRENGVLNSYIRFESLPFWKRSIGLECLSQLMNKSESAGQPIDIGKNDRSFESSYFASIKEKLNSTSTFGRLSGKLLLLGNVALRSPAIALEAYLRKKRGPTFQNRLVIRNFLEMEPHPDNRVTLSKQQDALGVTIPQIHHDATELDRKSLSHLHRTLDQSLRSQGKGFVKYAVSEDSSSWRWMEDASHHLGGARMGNNPKSSVTNSDLKVHSLDNLYVASGSVFPTSGCVNPTYTIVALAIRLSAHLNSKLSQ